MEKEKDKFKLIAASDATKTEKELSNLQKILPICSICKKIRDDDDSWHEVESYMREHSDTTFSHSVCPTCAKEFYGDLLEDDP